MIKQKFGRTGVKISVIGQGTRMIEEDPNTRSRGAETLRRGLELGMTHVDTACEQSLKRLNIEWLDMYLLYWPGSIPITETMRAMEKLVTEGLVRFIGVSNFDVEQLQAAENALRDQRMTCDEVLYHLGYRGIERRLLMYCNEQEIAVVGYAPFGHGNFQSSESVAGRLLAEIAERHGRIPRQVALNFLTRHPNVFTIPKTNYPERVKENRGGVGWNLTAEEIERIDFAFPVQEYDMPLQMI